MTKKDIKSTQHFTTKNHIIQNLWKDIPNNIQAIEPFYGSGDLIQNQPIDKYIEWEYYDIDIQDDLSVHVTQRDTLLNPPDYTNKYVITNPPYLAKNKALEKTLFDMYKDLGDLYKIAIETSMDALGGILVIPLNFLTDKRSKSIRSKFLKTFDIITLNIYTYPVFEDTNYQITTFSYKRRANNSISSPKTDVYIHDKLGGYKKLRLDILPDGDSGIYKYEYDNMFGKNKNKRSYTRLIDGNSYDKSKIIPIVFYLIDNNNDSFSKGVGDIRCEYGDDKVFFGKVSDRVIASFCLDGSVSISWEKVANLWNKEIRNYRKNTNNITLSSFRDANRKRMSFKEATALLDKIIDKVGI